MDFLEGVVEPNSGEYTLTWAMYSHVTHSQTETIQVNISPVIPNSEEIRWAN